MQLSTEIMKQWSHKAFATLLDFLAGLGSFFWLYTLHISLSATHFQQQTAVFRPYQLW